MSAEEDAEAWYDEEKRKILEKYLSALDKKTNQEKAQITYKKALDALFENYRKKKIAIIERQEKDARVAAKNRAKLKFNEGVVQKLMKKLRRQKK